MKMENSETTLCFGRDKWMIYFFVWKVSKEDLELFCVEVERDRVQRSIYLGNEKKKHFYHFWMWELGRR